MILFYKLGIQIYILAIQIAAPFHSKARKWILGRKNWVEKLKQQLNNESDVVWFHAASLGEFEQGRPVIEAFKKQYPDKEILLTFFSPSGYEVRKNYEEVDSVFYLPADCPKNAKLFMDIVQPKAAFFIKYEFWYHYLTELKNRNVPSYIFSAIFRPSQIFFKTYGSFYREMLHKFTHLFVQNQESVHLLKHIGICNFSLAGDTRFDRVYSIAKNAKTLPELEAFPKDREVLIAGSTWAKDEKHIIKYVNESNKPYKYIIAPHEINEKHLLKLTSQIQKPWIRYTHANKNEMACAEVLIVDCIGLLSSLYRYGTVAYIGGGFGKGIHNTLEAATFGLPIVFGPNYQKFQEAKDLIETGAAKSFGNDADFKMILDAFHDDSKLKTEAGKKSKEYVNKMRGATRKILNKIELNPIWTSLH